MAKPLFWTDKRLEPKRNYRFLVTLTGLPNGGQFYASKVTRPSFELGVTKHKYLGHTIKYPSNVTWNPVELTLVDPVSPDAMANITAIIEAAGYLIPKTPNDVSTLSKANLSALLGDVIIKQIDESVGSTTGGNALETWTLNNALIVKVNPSELSYEDDALSSIGLTLEYDWADLKTANGAINEAGSVAEGLGLPANHRWKLQ